MKKILLICNLLLSISLFSQDLKEISGFITNMNSPLADVNVVVKNTNRGTKTNEKGYYSIEAKEGEIISFVYVGMKTINIVIEDVTKILNIKMIPYENMLDEVTITGNKKTDFGSKSKSNKFSTSRGTIDSRKAGYGVSFMDGEDLNLATGGIEAAVQARFGNSRLIGAIWDIDGAIFKSPPPIDLANVIDVRAIRSLAGTISYGSEGRHGVIIVRTKSGTFDKTHIASKSNLYTNKEYYNNDALSIESIKNSQPIHIQLFDDIPNSQEAFKKYLEIRSSYENSPNFHFDIADYFLKSHSDIKSYQLVLTDLEYYAEKNAETLKALAYMYQKKSLHDKALNIYKKIMRLRPNYAQSFRDLANAYSHLKDYKNAWKIYRYYIEKGNTLEENAIGEIMYHEMEALYISKSKIANIKDVFKRKENSPDDISTDIRMVFEWNTSEAEFALEFVNPQKQSYVIEHSLDLSEELILDEKLKGYSSKEFIIDEIGTENWLVNINYLGNKKYLPTYLKVTIYYNWGRPNQAESINLFKLTAKDIKIQLLNLNSNSSNFFRNDN